MHNYVYIICKLWFCCLNNRYVFLINNFRFLHFFEVLWWCPNIHFHRLSSYLMHVQHCTKHGNIQKYFWSSLFQVYVFLNMFELCTPALKECKTIAPVLFLNAIPLRFLVIVWRYSLFLTWILLFLCLFPLFSFKHLLLLKCQSKCHYQPSLSTKWSLRGLPGPRTLCFKDIHRKFH